MAFKTCSAAVLFLHKLNHSIASSAISDQEVNLHFINDTKILHDLLK